MRRRQLRDPKGTLTLDNAVTGVVYDIELVGRVVRFHVWFETQPKEIVIPVNPQKVLVGNDGREIAAWRSSSLSGLALGPKSKIDLTWDLTRLQIAGEAW